MKKWLFIALLIIPLSVGAQTAQPPSQTNAAPDLIEFKPAIQGLDLTGCSAVADRGNFLGCYISALYTFLVQAAVILAVLMIIIGGFQYLLALGDTGKISDAKETIQVSIIGLVLALCSYLLFALINNQIVALRPLKIDDVTIKPSPTGFSQVLKVACESLKTATECNTSEYACQWDTINNACVVLGNKCPLSQAEYSGIKTDFQRFAHVDCCRTTDGNTTRWEYALTAEADCNKACDPHSGWVLVSATECKNNGKDW